MGGCKLQPKINVLWLILLAVTGLFSLLYLWFTLFPGRVDPAALQYFTAEQVERGRAYNMLPRLMFIGGFLAQAAFLLWMVFGGGGAALTRWAQQLAGSYYGSVLLFFFVTWLSLRLIGLPFRFFRGYYWQHRWGFSTQSLGSWWADYLKGAGLELLLSAAGVLVLFWILSRWPGTWWLAGAAFFSLWLVVQTLLWPVIVSPLFNRFEPAGNPAVANMVSELSRKAGLPVDQVLVMDASRRTTKANAYFTGLGKTKRIVLYDNLLEDYPRDQVKAVVAHEMAHWSRGHILQGLGLAVLGNFATWGLLFLLLRATLPPQVHQQPLTWAVILLFFMLVSFASSPLQNYISRHMELEADRVAVTLTGDVGAAIRLQKNLAAGNLSDVAPPAFIRWFSYSHPPAPERIRAMLQVAR